MQEFRLVSHLINIHPPNAAPPQLIYQNVQQQVTECEVSDALKHCDGPRDPSCDRQEEGQPLMKTNNYQFC